MNGTITMDARSGNQPRTGNWVTRGVVAAGRGVVLFGFTLASLVLWSVLLIVVALIPLGVGLPLTAATLRAIRGLEARAGGTEPTGAGSPQRLPAPRDPPAGKEGCRASGYGSVP